MKIILGVLVAVLGSACLHAAPEPVRFLQRLKLPTGQTVVVSEGDFEPRSIGSFSVRLYSGANAQFPTDDFVTGIIQERDGFIEKVVLADIDGDSRPEIIVIIRSAGSGSLLSARAFAFGRKTLVLRSSVAGLLPNADPVTSLLKAKTKQK